MILNASDDDTVKQQAMKGGMKTLRKSAVDEVLDGVATLDEIMRVVDMGAD